jgi:hypothetical protein
MAVNAGNVNRVMNALLTEDLANVWGVGLAH